MTTMNGLPRSCEPFIKGICSRRKLTKFSRLWRDCTLEEARLEAREKKLGNDENQALAAHARKGKNKVDDHPPRKFQKSQSIRRSKGITQVFDATVARRLDILQDIIL